MRLLEREDELATFEDMLLNGGVLVAEGGAGIGKTSLLAAATEHSSRPTSARWWQSPLLDG